MLVDPVLSGRASPVWFTTKAFDGTDPYTHVRVSLTIHKTLKLSRISLSLNIDCRDGIVNGL